ncbi:FecR/PupR family sigma factor regulator [Chitinasiproducens palmae]|uniref:FecR/PupR family sigma factor regulator n=1 Tax=Chitinasiproducens palmae TaxID=1770053 RepID=UPI001B8B3BA0
MARLWSDDTTDRDRAACRRWRDAHADHERAWRRLQGLSEQLAQTTPAVRRKWRYDRPASFHVPRRRAVGAAAS